MVGVVVDSDTVTAPAFLLRGEHLDIKELFGGDPLEPLNFPGFSGIVRASEPITGSIHVDHPSDTFGRSFISLLALQSWVGRGQRTRG